MKTIYLVRHGESTINVGDVFMGDDAPLTEKGREQARLLAERAARLDFEALLASPMARTKETAEIIAKATERRIEYHDVLHERQLPLSLVGKSKQDPAARAVFAAAVKVSEQGGERIQGAESFEDIRGRAAETLKLLKNHPAKTILVVGHGFFTRMLIAQMWFGDALTSEQFAPFVWGMRTKNTGLSVLRYDPDDAHRPWWLLVWNDHAHLG